MRLEAVKNWFTEKLLPLLAWSFAFQLIWASVFIIRMDMRIGFLDQRLTAIDNRITKTAETITTLSNRIDRQETPLALRVNTIETMVHQLNDRITGVSASTTSRFDQIGKDMDRVDERMNRLMMALDATYSLLNKHLRSDPVDKDAPRGDLFTQPPPPAGPRKD